MIVALPRSELNAAVDPSWTSPRRSATTVDKARPTRGSPILTISNDLEKGRTLSLPMESKTLDAQAEIPLLEFMNSTAGMARNRVVATLDPVASMRT